MKKIVLPLLICSSFAQAGTMGAVAEQRQHISPYLTGEAVYTWNSVQPSTFDSLSITQTKQGWGGRLGGGFAFSIAEEWALTTEIGGGYYGSVNSTYPLTNDKLSFDGYDVLFGGVYKYDAIDIFGQAGFMMQNSRNTTALNTLSYSSFEQNSSRSQTLPEIKVGGVYNFNNSYEFMNSMGISVAYMHVFGNNVESNVTAMTSGQLTGSSNNQGATFDAVLFGLHYTIA